MEFSHNIDRDAYATIAGFVLQVDLTVLRWLNLDDSELLELECGEDIDTVGTDIRSSVSAGTRLFEQVKRHQANITLRSAPRAAPSSSSSPPSFSSASKKRRSSLTGVQLPCHCPFLTIATVIELSDSG
jgi:hypothetical protein